MNTDAIVYRMQHGEKLEDLLGPVVEPRCKNCRFWDKGLSDGDKYECRKISSGESELAVITNNWAFVSVLETSPEFGCIHFERN